MARPRISEIDDIPTLKKIRRNNMVLAWIMVVLGIATFGSVFGPIVFFVAAIAFGASASAAKKRMEFLQFNPEEWRKENAREDSAGHGTKRSNDVEDRVGGEPEYGPLLEFLDEIGNRETNDYLPFPNTLNIEIEYTNREGNTTRREIDLIYIAKTNGSFDDYYFKAYCHLRDEERIFKIASVERAFADGEPVDFLPYVINEYRQTEKYKRLIAINKTGEMFSAKLYLGRAVRILVYIARVDGVFTRKEKIAIADYVMGVVGDGNNLGQEEYIIGLEQVEPTAAEYRTLIKKTDVNPALLEKAKSLVGSDPMRQGAFELLALQYNRNKPASGKDLADQAAED